MRRKFDVVAVWSVDRLGRSMQGKQLGRRKIGAKMEKAIRADLEAGGAGIQKLAKRHGVGVGAVQRIKTEMMELAVR